MIGQQLGPWILDEELGRGGMGTVFLAHHVETSEKAAVKVLAIEHTFDELTRDRFRREISVLKKLKHPNIVNLLDAGSENERRYYAMEYVEGKSFQDLVNEQRLPWEEVLDMALQVCQALKHAHDHGVIHRDLKPSNLLRGPTSEVNVGEIGQYGPVKLTDFGIAWVFAEPHLTKPGTIVGTAEHLSPEQAAGKQPTKRSDIYSLGTVMYTLLTGKPPFQGELIDLLHKHRYARVDPPHKIVPSMPHELDAIINEMMEKEPEKRPPDAGVLYRRLDILRRKIARKASQQTAHGEAGSNTAVEHQKEGTSGPATIMAELMREELQRQNRGGPIKQFFNHPIVLVTMFLATLGLIIWTLMPSSQITLFENAKELMLTNDPENYLEAEKLLDELEERFPNHQFQEEVQMFRETIVEDRAKRQARRMARMSPPMSEAEWFYEKGLRLRQQGNTKEAQTIWRTLVQVFEHAPSEAPWVERAKKELEEPSGRERVGEERWASVKKAIEKINQLEQANQQAEAEKIRQALRTLYQNDASAKAIINELAE